MTQLSTKSYRVDLLLVFYMAFPKFIRLAVLSALSFHRLTPITTISLLTLFLYFSQSRPTNTLSKTLSASLSRYYCFIGLPFKVSSVPYLLKKIFRPQVRFWTNTLMKRSCLLVHHSINHPRLYPSYPSLLRVNHTHATTTLCRLSPLHI